MSFKTILGDHGIELIHLKTSFTALSEVGGRPFHGKIHVTYAPVNCTLVVSSFEAWLTRLSFESFTVESFARRVLDELVNELGDVEITVRVDVKTEARGKLWVWATNLPDGDVHATG